MSQHVFDVANITSGYGASDTVCETHEMLAERWLQPWYVAYASAEVYVE